jgi:hypothetical protein
MRRPTDEPRALEPVEYPVELPEAEGPELAVTRIAVEFELIPMSTGVAPGDQAEDRI